MLLIKKFEKRLKGKNEKKDEKILSFLEIML
jgi:hypothetical protein